jgi:uncharacterized membrane protein
MRKEFYLTFIVAVLVSIAQYFLKSGANSLPSLTFSLFFGFFLYVLAMPLLVLSLIFGEISYVYPVLALSFIFVSLISVFFFHESLSFVNWLGIIFIFLGVSIVR